MLRKKGFDVEAFLGTVGLIVYIVGTICLVVWITLGTGNYVLAHITPEQKDFVVNRVAPGLLVAALIIGLAISRHGSFNNR